VREWLVGELRCILRFRRKKSCRKESFSPALCINTLSNACSLAQRSVQKISSFTKVMQIKKNSNRKSCAFLLTCLMESVAHNQQ